MMHNIDGLPLQYADDCSIITWAADDMVLQKKMEQNNLMLPTWLKKWRMVANCSKTDLITFRGTIRTQNTNNKNINISSKTKVLGLVLDKELKFKEHIQLTQAAINRKWNMLKPLYTTE
jgi:hypothetical protein